jgi:hypothetical protein
MSAEDYDSEPVTVYVPDELPVITPEVSRILLDILIELTETEVPEGPPRR